VSRGPATALIVWLLAVGGGARADEESPEKAQARVLLSQGNALFERGDLRGALADFRAAYALYPSPKLLVNAAAAEREIGDAAGAATDLRHFLDEATDDEGALVDRARADLRQLEKRVARIGLRGWPAHTTLEIDGRAARDPSYARPGPHTLKARAPVGVEETREVEVGAGDSFELVPPRGAVLVPAAASEARVATVERRAVVRKKPFPGWATALIVVGGIVVVGGAVAAVVVTTVGQPKTLSGDLGTIKFSQFH
jgi:hypothetical protein